MTTTPSPGSAAAPRPLRLRASQEQLKQQQDTHNNAAPRQISIQPRGSVTHRRSSSTNGSGQLSVPMQLHAAAAPGSKASKGLSVTQRALVASRVFRSNAIPWGLREQLDRDGSLWAGELLASKHIADVFAHYDVNGDEQLNRTEVALLAKDLIERWQAKFRDQLMREQGMSESAANSVVRREMGSMLPNGKNIDECRRAVADRLYKELDINRDDIVSRGEFMVQWQRSCKAFLTIEKPKSLGCNIQ